MVVGESETETVATAPASGVRTVTARDPLTPPLLATMATLPPLRNRRDDIRVLIDHFVEKHRQRTGKRIDRVDDEAARALERYEWPGNVRELENTIERAVVLATSPMLTPETISLLGATSTPAPGLPSMRLHQNLEWVERETIRRALSASALFSAKSPAAISMSGRKLWNFSGNCAREATR